MMILDFPLWPAELLMDVAEIENFAPSINSDLELPDDATLEIALQIPGGLTTYCHRQRLRDQKAGQSGVNHSHRRKQDDDS